MRKIVMCVGLAVVALAARAEVRTAEKLLVNISAADLSGLSDGASVVSWPNAGTLGGSFVPVSGGSGATYAANVCGAAAVKIAGGMSSLLTNSVKPTAEITGGTNWTFEAWVMNPTIDQGIETMFSWTPRSGLNDNAGTVMEFRYGTDANNAFEHWAANIGWGMDGVPAAGVWHHVVLARDLNHVERLYVDGTLRTAVTVANLNLATDGEFTIGGVRVRPLSGNTWDGGMYFSGYVGVVRVHSGTLSAEDVMNNYTNDAGRYIGYWNGAAGASLAWSDSANWLSGNVPSAGGYAVIQNGGTAVLSNSLALADFAMDKGGLTIDNGATLKVACSLFPAKMDAFKLTLTNGKLWLPGSSSVNLYGGQGGGAFTVEVGGAGSPAVLDVDRDTIIANASGSEGHITVGEGGLVLNSNGWFYVANTVGAKGFLTLNGGCFSNQVANKAFGINANGSYGEVTVNSGKMYVEDTLKWSPGTGYASATGILHLNGGLLEVGRLNADTTSGTNLLYMNGGTVKAFHSNDQFISNLTHAYIQAGGVTFDIPAGMTDTVPQILEADASSAGGGIAKTGDGKLILTGTNTVAGPVSVSAGTLLINNAAGLAGYTGAFTVTGGAGIGLGTAGGPAALLAKLDADADATLVLTSVNAADTVDFSARPNMKLRFEGNFTYTGTYIPYQAKYSYILSPGETLTVGTVLADSGSTAGRLEVSGPTNAIFVLTGANTFTGGILIDGCMVRSQNAAALGSLASGGARDVTLTNNAVLVFDTAQDLTAFVANRLTTYSQGTLLLGPTGLGGYSMDLSGHPGITVGAAPNTNSTYTATITPAGDTFKLGGGNSSYTSPLSGFKASTLADGTSARKVVIDKPGIVQLASGNTYSGGTIVSNRAALYLANDGLGAVPATAAPENLLVDNGTVRGGMGNVSLPATRGVKVGAGGATFHQWSTYTFDILGNLSGTGPIQMTDTGWVTFGGAANTYSGQLTVTGGARTRIGTGGTFSWVGSESNIVNGTLALKMDGDKSLPLVFSGTGTLQKEGTGTLTLTSPQSYATTTVAGGTLRVSGNSILPNATGKGLVDVGKAGTFETDGQGLAVAAVSGFGLITNGTAAADTLTLGSDSVSGAFYGTIDRTINIVKTGSGSQVLGATPLPSVTVNSGILGLKNQTVDSLSLSGGEVAVKNANGLDGYYYSFSPTAADIATLAAIAAVQSNYIAEAVINSCEMGNAFDTASDGSCFPANFRAGRENFVAVWKGYFLAEAAGSYTFATCSDDGSIVFIDGTKVVDNNADQGYTAADRTGTRGSITLTAGYHPIVIGFYEKTGGNAITVFLTRPGASSDEALPNSLLSSKAALVASVITNFSNVSGTTLSFENAGFPALMLASPADATLASKLVSSNANAILEKTGAGTLTLTSRDSGYAGIIRASEGTVALSSAGILGTLSAANGASVTVSSESGLSGGRGLICRYYDCTASNDSYTEFKTYSAMLSHFSSMTPYLVTNTLSIGDSMDFTATGIAFHGKYGANADNFEIYLSGYIQIDAAGTYSFGSRSDDGSVIYIDGATATTALAKNTGVPADPVGGTYTLSAGLHRIDICYREVGGGAGLFLYMKAPGETSWKLIPQNILFRGGSVAGALTGEAGSALTLNGATGLALEQDTDTAFAGDITAPAGSVLVKSGSGTLTLSGANPAFAGLLDVAGGKVDISGGIGSASLNIARGAIASFSGSGTQTLSGPLTGSGALVINGPGEVIVSGTNDFTGTVLVNGGKFTVKPGASLGKAAVIAGTGTLAVETSGTASGFSQLGALSGSGNVLVTGTGTLLLDTENASAKTTVASGATAKASGAASIGGGVALEGGTIDLAASAAANPTNVLATFNNSGLWQFNGNATLKIWSGTNAIEMTQNGGSQAGTAFLKAQLNVASPWLASWRYSVGESSDPPADGTAFLLQNSSSGATALGPDGGCFGGAYTESDTRVALTPSIGLYCNLYAGTVGWVVNGAKVGDAAPGSIDIRQGANITVSYDGARLTACLTQGGASYVTSYDVSLAGFFGQASAYVGFTAGTGGLTARQTVSEFKMLGGAAGDSDYSASAVTLAAGQTGVIALTATNAATTLGTLDLAAGSSVTLAADSGSVSGKGFTLDVADIILGGDAAVSIAPNGAGAGTLALGTLDCTSGGVLTVTGGNVTAADGTITVIVATPVKRGVTYLGDFTGATWVGPAPAIVLKDASGNVLDQKAYFSNGKLYINTLTGIFILLR